MGTNKTRLYFKDVSSGGAPYDIQAVVEFDIYNEALDYAKAICVTSLNLDIFLYSYENTSYRVYGISTAPFYALTEITFPVS